MTDQTTPRTDAIANDEDSLPHKVVRFASLARSLEREAAKLRAALELADHFFGHYGYPIAAEQQVAQIRAALAKAGV